MLNRYKEIVKTFIINRPRRKLPLTWVKRGQDSWLSKHFIGDFIKPPVSTYYSQIETLAKSTNQLGKQPLWKGYENNNIGTSTRLPDNVRSLPSVGNLFTYIVQLKKPEIVVEFGTAFGVSGMYFLAGLNLNDKGLLLTFDPNDVWAKIAKENLTHISSRFLLTIGTFEDHIKRVLPDNKKIDIAFIDAIHTKEFVIPQLELVIANSNKGAIIILDDISFSENMKACWNEVSIDDRFVSSLSFGNRVGTLELR